MKPGGSGFGPIRLLLSLSCLLGAVLAWSWFDETGQLRDLAWVAPKALTPDIKGPTDFSRAGGQQDNPTTYAVILERPLFAPDRKPPPPPAPSAPPDPLGNVQIHGIYTGENAGILARVDDKVRRVKLNETIGPWTLKSIAGREVTFTRGGESRQLPLAYAKLAANPKPPVPTPTADARATNPPAFDGPLNVVQKAQDENRQRLERRNAMRASRGLPALTE